MEGGQVHLRNFSRLRVKNKLAAYTLKRRKDFVSIHQNIHCIVNGNTRMIKFYTNVVLKTYKSRGKSEKGVYQ